jgi:hypothetical protein
VLRTFKRIRFNGIKISEGDPNSSKGHRWCLFNLVPRAEPFTSGSSPERGHHGNSPAKRIKRVAQTETKHAGEVLTNRLVKC